MRERHPVLGPKALRVEDAGDGLGALAAGDVQLEDAPHHDRLDRLRDE